MIQALFFRMMEKGQRLGTSFQESQRSKPEGLTTSAGGTDRTLRYARENDGVWMK